MNKIIVITGVSGMDGSILSEKYLEDSKNIVVGIDVWNATGQYPNLKKIINNDRFVFITGDITEKLFIQDIIKKYRPDYFYNFAAISLVPESFKIPQRVFEINAVAVLNMLEMIKTHSPKTKFYQASTSEQLGDYLKTPQNTESPMFPNSPYAIAKLASFHLVRCYRNAFGLFAVNGMLWNHEGPRRGPTFVTRKITLHIASQVKGNKEPLQIGNMDAIRDWGLADDYVDAQIMMMEHDEPDDWAVNTEEAHSVREFIEEAYKYISKEIIWKGEGSNEKGYDEKGNLLVEVNPEFYRPVEVPYLKGDSSKIREKLGWVPKVKFKELVKLMMEHELK